MGCPLVASAVPTVTKEDARVTGHDRALIVVLRAAQWLLDEVANDLRRGRLNSERTSELRKALVEIIALLDQRCPR